MSLAVTFKITLEDPALFAALEGDPNSTVTHDHIPGSALRGMAIGLWMRSHQLADLNVTDQACRDLFFNSSVRWLNAYPIGFGGTRTLPVPRNWMRPKYGDTSKIYVLPKGQPPNDAKSKPPTGFMTREQTTVHLIKPNRTLKVHVQRNRRLGRAVSEDGAVYRYESLASGQGFMGAVLCNTNAQANTIRTLITKTNRVVIGGVRSAGYGTCLISDVTVDTNWQEYVIPSTQNGTGQKDHHRVTLLSNAVVRDENGLECADVHALARALGVEANDVEEAFVETEVVGGFNRKWGLPLPQTLSAKMGSVLITRKGIPPGVIERGIGERRSEGFGRISVEQESSASALIVAGSRQASKPTTDSAPKHLSIEVPPADARKPLRRLMLQQLEYATIADGQDVMLKNLTIKRSQTTRLRAEVRRRLSSGNPETDFGPFFSELRETARNQFNRQKISGKSVPDWIHSLALENKQKKISEKFAAVWDSAADNARAKLLLIDAVLARLYKESKDND